MNIAILDEGIIWKHSNAEGKPLVAAKGHSVDLGNGEILHSFQVGSGRQSPDVRCMLTRSMNHGKTWSEPVPFPRAPTMTRDASLAWFGRTSTGALRATVNCYHNVGKDDPRWKKENGGWVGMSAHASESADGGKTWLTSPPLRLPDPAGGFSVASSDIHELPSGEWMLVIEPMASGTMATLVHEAAVIFSRDQGQTWGAKALMAQDPGHLIYYFDPRIAQLHDGRFVGLFWTHDIKADTSLQTTIGWSDDGHQWSPPRPTPLWGFLTLPLVLADGRLLAVYNHRRDPQGIRCALSQDGGQTWDMDQEYVLWDQRVRRITGELAAESVARQWEGSVLAEMFTSFQFGIPHPTQLDDGSVFVSFYATLEDGVMHQRFVRFTVD